mgnify:CR=1 FL=1|jgi:hypothetical protein|tara:strand:+ start:262 stop:603 length:342 start_codon:yes stop_codon:yes gene_type:complete
MRERHTFREPLGRDLNGLYITAAQMKFFLNRRHGSEAFLKGTSEFFEYFYKCAVYNIVWDLAEKDPACATFFWDVESDSIGLKFPSNGKVIKELKKKKVKYFFEDEEDEENTV